MMKNKSFANEVVSNEVVLNEQVECGKVSLLSAEEEVALSQLVAQGGDDGISARNKLVEANVRLVSVVAKKYLWSGMDMEELISMGYEGLIRAAEKYDGNLGTRFSTCAMPWIDQAISRGIAAESTTIRIPVHMRAAMYKVKQAQKHFLQECGEEASVSDIAEYTGFTVEKVHEVLSFITYNTVSLDTKVGDDGKSTIEDFCADENADDPCDVVVLEDLQENIQYVLDKLEPKEALVLKLRNGFIGERPLTLDEVAKLPEFGVTRERIRQIEAKAIKKIRNSFSSMQHLSEYVR